VLSESAAAAVAAALVELLRATERQEAAAEDASSGINAWWTEAIGADSSAAGLRTNAKAARTLYDAMTARAARITTDEDARVLVRDVGGFVDTRGIEAAAAFLTPGAAAVEVAKGTARDLAMVAQDVGGGFLALLKASPLIVGAVLVLWLWTWLPKKKAAP
jgi:hypothetical protein